MMKAIDAALVKPKHAKPQVTNGVEPIRVVCFMTDGYVGNDMGIIDAVKKNAGTTRVFSFGIGNSVNRFLLDGMAQAGRGEVEYVTLESKAQEAADRFYQRIDAPVLTDVAIDFGNHFRQLDLVRERFEQFENCRAADYRDGSCSRGSDSAVDVMNHVDALDLPFRVVSHDDMLPTGENAGEAVEGLAAHDHRAAHGQLLEAPEIARNVPGKHPILADHAIDGAGKDDGDRRVGHRLTWPQGRGFAKP
jgi:hypothetical protein